MSDPFIGSLALFGFSFAPRGWALCDGAILPISSYSALFSLLGTTYGGDGETTFALPDLRGRIPLHLSGDLPMGQRGGEESHTLTLAELGSHAHPAIGSSAGGQATAGGNLWGTAPDGELLYGVTPDRPMSNPAIADAGVDTPAAHENRSPYLVANWCIALTGVFPVED